MNGSSTRSRRVSLRPHVPESARRLARELGIPEPAARVLSARGFDDPAAARAHLAPAPESLHDPSGMAGIPEAVRRIAETARRGGRIVVLGDYDCDGVSALAVLTTVLKRLGADVRPVIPHRLRDGYGLKTPTLLRALAEHEPEGIVTVDCGITAVDPVQIAVERGVWVIVTDHHLPPAALPEGAVLVDPKLPGCAYPFKELCGAGLAFKLAEALLLECGAAAGIDAGARRAWLASLAKVVALATVADVVPLVGENRVLVAWGLAGLAEPRAPGLAALLRRSGVPAGRPPSAREVAFRIAPRLNAAGRVDHAFLSLELLTTSDTARAEELADTLERANEERRALQERVVAEVLSRLETGFDPDRDAIVVEAGQAADGWHRGVLGIAASRVAERVARPVLLLSEEDDTMAGSGRSYGRTPLFERLAPVARRHAREFGGHEAALGLTLASASYPAFREEARAAFAERRSEEEWRDDLLADAETHPREADLTLADALDRLEPHGRENPRALLLLRGLEWDGRAQPVGPRGLRFRLLSEGTALDAVGWSLADLPAASRRGRFTVAANLARDAYTGRASLTVLDLAPEAP